MKITCPISSPDEVEMLAENGADELYCGLIPPEWLSAYNVAVWLNRRSPASANLLSYERLAALVHKAHRYRIPVFLTLNAHYYTQEQLAVVIGLARRAMEVGIDAFILSDPALILALRDHDINAAVHISALGTAFNSETVGFYRDLGASRVILPRELSLEEMKRTLTAVASSIQCEAFVLNDGCAYVEGFCLTTHSVGQAFCYRDWRYTFHSLRSARGVSRESKLLEEHYGHYREWIWCLSGCGCSTSQRGLPNGPCGLCAIKSLYDMGIASIKIAGRQASPLRKLLSLRAVRAVLEIIRRGASEEDAGSFSRALRDTPVFCQSGYMCYYR